MYHSPQVMSSFDLPYQDSWMQNSSASTTRLDDSRLHHIPNVTQKVK
jgi:hypothetical protein